MYNDTKTSWDRIGGRYVYPKIAWAVIGLWITFTGFVLLTMAVEYHKVSAMHESDLIAQIRFNNTH